MADDNRIEIEARLDLDTSEKLIRKDLDAIQSNLKDFTLEIKTQLAKISNNKVKIFDTSSIKKQALELEKILDLKIPRGQTKEVREEIRHLLSDYQELFSQGRHNEVSAAFEKLGDYVSQFRKELGTANEDLIEQQNLIKSIAREGKVYIGDTIWGDLSYSAGSKSDAIGVLNSVFGSSWTRNRSKATTVFDSLVQTINDQFNSNNINSLDDGFFESTAEGILRLQKYLKKNFKDTSEEMQHYANDIAKKWDNDVFNAINKVIGLGDKVGTEFQKFKEPLSEYREVISGIDAEIDSLKTDLSLAFGVKENNITTTFSKNAQGEITGFSLGVKKLSGETEKFNYSLRKTKDGVQQIAELGSTGTDRGMLKVLSDAENQANKLDVRLGLLREKFIGDNAIQPVVSTENQSQLAEKFDLATNAINKFRESSSETFVQTKIDAEKAIATYNNFATSLNKAEKGASDFRAKGVETQRARLSSKFDSFLTRVSKSSISAYDKDNFDKQIDLFKRKLSEIGDIPGIQNLNDNFDQVEASFISLNTAIAKESAFETLRNRINKTSASLDAYANKNKKAVISNKTMSDGITTFADKWNELTSKIKSGNLTADEIKHINEEFATFRNEVKAAGLDSGAFFRSMTSQIKMIVVQWISLNTVIGKTREMIENVINIDNAMVNLKKVTNETDETYEKFLDNADFRARKLHSTMSDFITQTSEWAKLDSNLSLDEASELAEISMVYSKVGEVDNQTSVSDLVSIMKGFNIEAKDAMSIVDRLNKLGNEFATDSGSLGDGLSVSASALAMANNDLSETLAMLTGGTEITQDADAMGNALRVISMRIRGMKGELEELNEETEGIESISKIQTQILNLTGNKVNIFGSDGKFRSTYDILKDISEIYNDLSDPSRADLTEILFGKNRANQGIAVIQAFQSGQIEKAYEAAENSSGSAMAEFEEISKGIESHINDFHESWESLSKDFIDSDFLKTIIDSGTKLIDILDVLIKRFGTFPTITAAIAGGLSFKGVGKPKTEYA